MVLKSVFKFSTVSLLFLFTSLNASNYCAYHINAPGCKNIAKIIKQTDFRTVIDRSYTEQTLTKPFDSLLFSKIDIKEDKVSQKTQDLSTKEQPSQTKQTTKEEKSKESSQSKQDSKKKKEKKVSDKLLRIGTSVGAFMAEDTSSYSYAMGYYPKNNFFYTLSLSYIKNDKEDIKGAGDSVAGIGYNWTKHTSTSIQGIIPTGDEEKGTGLGANGYIISQNFGVDVGFLVSLDLSYSGYSKSKEYEVQYGSKYSAALSSKFKINSISTFDIKLSYYHSNSNKLNDEDLKDEITFKDAMVGLNFSFFGFNMAKLGATVPLPQELGGETYDKRNGAFYFSLSRLF
jgi:hypothetical protein